MPILGGVTLVLAIVPVGIALVQFRHLFLADEFSWRTFAIALLAGWLGLWQLVAGAGLLLRGYQGAGAAVEWSDCMLSPPLLFRGDSGRLWPSEYGADDDPAGFGWARIVTTVLVTGVLALVAHSFPERDLWPYVGLAALTLWPAIVALRVHAVHERLVREGHRRRTDARRRALHGRATLRSV